MPELAQRAADADLATAVENVYAIALSRAPTEDEGTDAGQFLAAQSKSYVDDGKSAAEASQLALTDLCHTILSLNEFVFVE